MSDAAIPFKAERILTLPVNAIYFDQIKAGEKTQEFRLVNRYWSKRLEFGEYDLVTITKGYPAAGDRDRRITFPWRGYELKFLQHDHFGPDPVEVFAIHLNADLNEAQF